jgi:hypothetical protein
MNRSAKHLLASLLAIFAMASLGLSAVPAGTMALEMSAMTDDMDPAGSCVTPCPGEPQDADAMDCLSVCVAPAIAVLPAAVSLAVPRASRGYALVDLTLLDRVSVPDPYPPRI